MRSAWKMTENRLADLIKRTANWFNRQNVQLIVENDKAQFNRQNIQLIVENDKAQFNRQNMQLIVENDRAQFNGQNIQQCSRLCTCPKISQVKFFADFTKVIWMSLSINQGAPLKGTHIPKDHKCTLKILQSTSEFGGLRKCQNKSSMH